MANNDSSRQAANIEDLMNSGVDIVIARALDAAAIGASIRRAKEAGMPFVTFDRASSGAQPTAHVGGDSKDQAKVLGEEFVKILTANKVDAKCIELQGSLADINAINRTNEFKKLDESSDIIEIVAQIPTEWNPGDRAVGTDRRDARAPGGELHPGGIRLGDRCGPGGARKVRQMAPDGRAQARLDRLERPLDQRHRGHGKRLHRRRGDLGRRRARQGGRAGAAADRPGQGPRLPAEGCLAKGSVATPATVKGMTDYWARKYK